jgi:hypothetical protein
MSKARLMLALVNLALLASFLGKYKVSKTFPDGD